MPLPTKSQVNRLGDRLAHAVTPEDMQAYFSLRSAYADALASVEQQVVNDFPGRDVASRLKTLDSVLAKLRRDRTRLSSMQDIAGCRLIVRDLGEQDAAAGALRERYASARSYDLRERPHSGYRAVHVIVESDGIPVEIQVRTLVQESWARLSEQLMDRYGSGVKYGGGPPEVRAVLDELSSRASAIDRALAAGGATPEARERAAEAWGAVSATAIAGLPTAAERD